MSRNSLTPLLERAHRLAQAVAVDSPGDDNPAIASSALMFSDLQSFFQKTLGDCVVSVLPETRDTASPLNTTPGSGAQAIIKCLKSMITWHIKDKSTQNPQQPGIQLQKPLIMLFPIQSEATLPNAASPWISVVVLPKNYQAPFGAPTDNLKQHIIYMDSCVTAANADEIPAHFKLFYELITKGCTIPSQQLIIPPVFPNADFRNISHYQQKDHSDSLGFAAYNALMIVLTGSGKFAESMQPSWALSHRLQHMISKCLSPAAAAASAFAAAPAASCSRSEAPEEPVLDQATALARLLARLAELKIQEESYAEIENHLRIGLLYAFIINERKKYHVTQNNTPDELKEMLQHDENARRQFYRLPKNDLTIYLQRLNVEALKNLLDLSQTPNLLLQQLKNTREAHYQQLIRWEIQIQKLIIARAEDWVSYFGKKTNECGRFVYNNSLMGLGGEFASLFAQVLSTQPLPQIFAAILKQMVLQCIKYFVFCATASQEQAEQTRASVANWLTEHNLLILFKLAGMLVGIYYTYLAGVFSLFRLLTMNLVALKASQQLSEGVIDDINARVVSASDVLPVDPTYAFCFRVMIMLSALVETLYTKSSAPCVRALGSLSGSVAMTRLGQQVMPELRVPSNQKPTPEQMLAFFVLSNMGHGLGECVANTAVDVVNNIQAKTQARDEAIAALRSREIKGELVDLNIATPSLLTPSLLWFNEKNPLNMRWRNPSDGRVYSTRCQITPSRLACDPVTDVLALNAAP